MRQEDDMTDPNNDEQQIHALFEMGDRALMAADIDTLATVFGEDYVQYDATGRGFRSARSSRICAPQPSDIRRSCQQGGRSDCLGTWPSCTARRRTKWKQPGSEPRSSISTWMFV